MIQRAGSNVTTVRSFVRRFALVATTAVLSSSPVLAFIGLVNERLLGRRLATATLFYFADGRYLESVTFPWYARYRRWSPVLAGVFLQRHSGGLICVAGCTEEMFSQPEHREEMRAMYERMEKMARLLRVTAASYAGVLPSEIAKMGVRRSPIEIERTVVWVDQALSEVLSRSELPDETPLVVLGAAGFLGKRVMERLASSRKANIHPVDVHIQPLAWPRGRIVLINVSRGQALSRYVDLLEPGSVVLNEVYPEATTDVIEDLRRRGVRYFHIKGVAAQAFPAFPRAYAGAVPCCAASAALTPAEGGGLRQDETVLLVEL